MPYVLESPNILSRWPQYDPANGSRSDTTIEIVFDHDMDIDSILYTQNEIEALPTGVTPLESSVHPGRYYGYETAVGDRVFKNIQITEKQYSANFAKYYGEPVFEDSMTLFIPVVSYDELTAGKIIIISLSNDFHYKDKETDIPVYIGSSEKKWRYIVNGQRDKSAPVYENTIEFSVNGTTPAVASDITDFNVLNCFISDGSSVPLKLNNVLVSDSESYPTSLFIMEFKKVCDDKFSALTAPEDFTRTINYDYALGTSAKYGVLPDPDPDTGSYELTNLPDGVYSIRYKFKDRSENTSYYPARSGTAENPIDNYFFFAVDTNSPDLAGPISEVASAKTASSVTIAVPGLVWNSNDIKSKKLIYTPQGGNATEFAITSLGTNVELTGLTAGTQYSIKAKIEDYSGNTYESDAITVYTKPNAPTNLALNDSSLEQNSFSVNWTGTAGNYDNYTLYYKKATDTAYTTKTINKGTTTYSLSSLSPKTKYNCYLVSKKNNVESEPVLLNVVTKPAVPTLTKVESLYTNGNPGFKI